METAFVRPCTLILTSTALQSGDKTKAREDSKKKGIFSNEIQPWRLDVKAPKDPSIITIPLSSLNPQKVRTKVVAQMLASSGKVILETTDSKEVIVWQGADKIFNAKSITIGFRDTEMPESVSKALIHAINLCGGKPDKKEPF